jgi:aminoglycoside phosphotransferase (APT) family kinase protein
MITTIPIQSVPKRQFRSERPTGFAAARPASVDGSPELGVLHYRSVMSSAAAPGPLLGTGRSADVFALGSDRVLRRYRFPIDATVEAGLMRYLAAQGYPVPEVYDAEGRDLVMERLDGPDMLTDLGRRPWLIARHARTLADLHNRLHRISGPPGWPAAVGRDGTALATGTAVVHLDLHPANVMLTKRGPVVIDWVGARIGAPGADVAIAYLIMATADTDLIPLTLRPVVGSLRRAFCRRFLAAAQDSPWPHLASAARVRIADVNTRPAEAARLLRFAEQTDTFGPAR